MVMCGFSILKGLVTFIIFIGLFVALCDFDDKMSGDTTMFFCIGKID